MSSVDAILRMLRGEPVNAVSFVMDYVEIGFNGPVIRCIANPIVEIDGASHMFPETGSRDALAKLIGRNLTSLKYEAEARMSLRFDNNARLIIPLDAASRHGGEAFHFVPGLNRPIEIW